MKKIICFLLSAMLFLMPVLSQAENFLDKVSELVDRGSEVTITSQFVPGDALIKTINDEKSAQAARELFENVKLKISFQSIDELFQSGLRLLINDQQALELLFGKDEDELLLNSDLLGENTYVISKEDLQKIFETASAEMSDEEKQTLDGTLDMLFPSVDTSEEFNQKSHELLAELLDDLNNSIEENTDDTEGETLLLDGSETGKGIVITLSKEKIGEMIAKFISRYAAILEQGYSFVKVDFKGKTPDDIAKEISDAFQSDLSLRIYVDDEKVISVWEFDFGPDAESKAAFRDENVINMEEDKLTVDRLILITNADGEQMSIRSDGDITEDHMVFNAAVNMTEDGKEEILCTVDGNLAYTTSDHYAGLFGAINFVLPENEAELKVELSGKGNYSDDEAQFDLKASVSMSPDLSQPLFTVDTDFYAGPAEAYMTGENAVHILQLSEEEQQKTVEEWQKNMILKVFSLMQLLPESLQELLLGSFT